MGHLVEGCATISGNRKMIPTSRPEVDQPQVHDPDPGNSNHPALYRRQGGLLAAFKAHLLDGRDNRHPKDQHRQGIHRVVALQEAAGEGVMQVLTRWLWRVQAPHRPDKGHEKDNKKHYQKDWIENLTDDFGDLSFPHRKEVNQQEK